MSGIAGGKHTGGLFKSSTGGRADKIKTSVKAKGYVVPADVVSGLGAGNTSAGAKTLGHLFGPAGPYKFKKASAPRKFADGGSVPIKASGGEYYIPPETVERIGEGDVNHGCEILDHFVKQCRQDNIDRMKNLPGPQQ